MTYMGTMGLQGDGAGRGNIVLPRERRIDVLELLELSKLHGKSPNFLFEGK
jgi:hypothetical protein